MCWVASCDVCQKGTKGVDSEYKNSSGDGLCFARVKLWQMLLDLIRFCLKLKVFLINRNMELLKINVE